MDEGQLSPLVDRDAPLRGLLPEYGRRWPRFADVPWFPALGDGAAANVGSGCLGPSRVALTVGTSGALRLALQHIYSQEGAGFCNPTWPSSRADAILAV